MGRLAPASALRFAGFYKRKRATRLTEREWQPSPLPLECTRRADDPFGPCVWERRFGHGTRRTQAGRHSRCGSRATAGLWAPTRAALFKPSRRTGRARRSDDRRVTAGRPRRRVTASSSSSAVWWMRNAVRPQMQAGIMGQTSMLLSSPMFRVRFSHR